MKKSLICIFLAVIFLFSACGKTDITNTDVNSLNENKTDSSVSNETIEQQSEATVTQSDTENSSDATSKKGNYIKAQVTAAKNDSSQTEKSTEAPKADTVSLSVNCSNAVNYGIRDNQAFETIIPENGIVFSSDNIEISDGETVMSLLKKTLKENKIVYQITSGGYVKSIGGLSEFDCGSNSGWLYKVNGEKPNVSTKSYKLTAGDKVEFIYTCKNGDV